MKMEREIVQMREMKYFLPLIYNFGFVQTDTFVHHVSSFLYATKFIS